MNDSPPSTGPNSDFWGCLGIGIAIFLICLGIGGCSVMCDYGMSIRFKSEQPEKPLNP
jgi:hypothetical protein